MFALESNRRYFMYNGAVDMRNGIRGLCRVVSTQLGMSPLSGDVYVFLSANRQSVKILVWDGDGFLLYHKRLEKGSFESPLQKGGTTNYLVSWSDFLLIMQGISLSSARKRKRFAFV